MAININLFGGPSVGKSLNSLKLAARMKSKKYKSEYNSEYAKRLTYGKDYTKLKDQILILGQQLHPQWVMNDQLDYIIHDSPFIQGLLYLNKNDNHIPLKEFTDLVIATNKTYDNINIFIERNNDLFPYQEYGRNQTLQEAIEKDNEIKAMLDDNDIPYYIVKSQKKADKEIFRIIQSLKGK